MQDQGDNAVVLSGGAQFVLYSVGAVVASLALCLVYYGARVVFRLLSGAAATSGRLFSAKIPAQQQGKRASKHDGMQAAEKAAASEPKKHSISLRQAKEAAKKQAGKNAKPAKHSHKLFLGTLQGHQDNVTGCAMSWDSGMVATSCEDRNIRIFCLADAVKGSKHSANPRTKISIMKTPTGVAFGNSSEELVVSTSGLLGHANLAMYTKKGGSEPAWELEDCMSKKSVLDGGLASGYRELHVGQKTLPGHPIIVAAAGGGSTELRIFSARSKGRLLDKLDSGQMKNYMLTVSPNGRFVSVGAFTAEMKVWEIGFSREGAYLDTHMVMALKGHSSQVRCVGFSSDCTKAFTASLDGTLGVWNLSVRYQLNEDAKRILKVPLPLPQGQCYNRLAVAPESSGGCIAASYQNSIHFLCPATGKLLDEVQDAHHGGILQMVWSRQAVDTLHGVQAVLVTVGGDHNVRVWGCPTAANVPPSS